MARISCAAASPSSRSVSITTSERKEANWRTRLLAVISNPEIVLILGLIGIYGLMYEGWNPGAIVPGVVGAICLLLAAYALQVIPVASPSAVGSMVWLPRQSQRTSVLVISHILPSVARAAI